MNQGHPEFAQYLTEVQKKEVVAALSLEEKALDGIYLNGDAVFTTAVKKRSGKNLPLS